MARRGSAARDIARAERKLAQMQMAQKLAREAHKRRLMGVRLLEADGEPSLALQTSPDLILMEDGTSTFLTEL